jgi:hypothetical protein
MITTMTEIQKLRLAKRTLRLVLSWARQRPSERSYLTMRNGRRLVTMDVFNEVRRTLKTINGQYDYPQPSGRINKSKASEGD